MTGVLAAPEALRWLRTPVREGTPVVVAGVAGGVGASTVARLLGALVDEAGRAGDLEVRDVGSEAPATGAADEPGAVVVVVCGATRAGATAAADALAVLASRTGEGSVLARAVVAAVPVTGRGAAPADLLAILRSRQPGAELVVLPRSRALAAAGRLPTAAEDPAVHGRGVALLAAVVRAARWVSVRG